MCFFSKLQEALVKDRLSLHPYSWLVKNSVTNWVCFIWKVILNLEIQILIFARSHRGGNFQLYRQILCKTMRWYFSHDPFHYARWFRVHIFDLMVLKLLTTMCLRTSFNDIFVLRNLIWCFWWWDWTSSTSKIIGQSKVCHQVLLQTGWMIRPLFGGRHEMLKFYRLLRSSKIDLDLKS